MAPAQGPGNRLMIKEGPSEYEWLVATSIRWSECDVADHAAIFLVGLIDDGLKCRLPVLIIGFDRQHLRSGFHFRGEVRRDHAQRCADYGLRQGTWVRGFYDPAKRKGFVEILAERPSLPEYSINPSGECCQMIDEGSRAIGVFNEPPAPQAE